MPKYKTSLRTTRMDDITAAASTTAFHKVYSGSGPALTAAPTGTLLVSIPLPNPIAAGAASGVLTLSAISDATGAATGTPGYVRLTNSNTDDGTHTVAQYTAGIGSGECNFSGQVFSGGTVSTTSFVVTEGNA